MTGGGDGPADRAALAGLAAACIRTGAAPEPMAPPPPRDFSLAEIAQSFIPVAPAHLRRVLGAHPELPQGRADARGTRRFTLAEVGALRAHLAATGAAAKAYLPWRPEGLPARVVTVAQARAGTGKTTTAAHLALAAARDGYRVLAIDLDPQGGLTAMLGGSEGGAGVLSLLARAHARHLQTGNRARVLRGEAAQPLAAELDAALGVTTQSLLQPLRWPGIGLIGAGLDLARAELRLAAWRMAARDWRPWEALRAALAADGALAAHDIVVIDTPPALGFLSLAGIAAADLLLIPTGARAADCAATGRFLGLLEGSLAAIEAEENLAARALGQPGIAFGWDAVRLVLARHDPEAEAGEAALLQAALGPALMPQRLAFTPLLAAAPTQPVYEAVARGTAGRAALQQGCASFDRFYAGVRALLQDSWRANRRGD